MMKVFHFESDDQDDSLSNSCADLEDKMMVPLPSRSCMNIHIRYIEEASRFDRRAKLATFTDRAKMMFLLSGRPSNEKSPPPNRLYVFRVGVHWSNWSAPSGFLVMFTTGKKFPSNEAGWY